MDFQLPELGEGIYEAELVHWLIKPGDRVRRGQTLMEVMTDKATMEVPSPFAGVIESLAAQEGRQLKVGEVILTYKAADQKSEGEKSEGESRLTASVPSARRGRARPLGRRRRRGRRPRRPAWRARRT